MCAMQSRQRRGGSLQLQLFVAMKYYRYYVVVLFVQKLRRAIGAAAAGPRSILRVVFDRVFLALPSIRAGSRRNSVEKKLELE